MMQLPGESEPIPSIFRCTICGDALVMLVVNPPKSRLKRGPTKGSKKSERVELLLSISKQQVEQVLAEFERPFPALSSRGSSRHAHDEAGREE